MAAKKQPDPPGPMEFIRQLRDAGVLEYQGPLFGDVVVTLKLAPTPAAAPTRPVTGVAVGPAKKDAPPEVPKHLAAAGVTPEQYAAALERAGELIPS